MIINAMKKQKQEKRIGNAMEKREEMLFKISKVFLIGWHRSSVLNEAEGWSIDNRDMRGMCQAEATANVMALRQQ